jgi:amino acid adenylation domain-containing protein
MNQQLETLPLTGAQRALWAGNKQRESRPEEREGAALGAEGSTKAVLVIEGSLDVERLQRALSAAAAVHPVLSFQFVHVSGHSGLRQAPADTPAACRFEVFDLWGQPDAEQKLADALAGLGVVGGSQPAAVVAALYQTGQTSFRLLLAVSSLTSDRAGLGLLSRSIVEQYRGLRRVESAAEPVTSYEQFARWCEDLELSEDGARGTSYWKEYLAGSSLADGTAGPLRIPGRRAAALPTARRASVSSRVDSALAAKLLDLARSQEVPVEAVLQAAWWALLCRVTGQEEFIGAWSHDCRADYEAISTTVGLFEKSLPLRVRLLPRDSFMQWLTRVAQTLNQHRDWQESWPSSDWQDSRLCGAGFRLEQVSETSLETSPAPAPGFTLERQPLSVPGCELVLAARVAGEQLSELVLDYAPDQHAPEVPVILLRQLGALLDSLPESLFSRIEELPLIGPEERAVLLGMHQPALPVGTRSLPEYVAAWAASAPAALAVIADDVIYSYATLERESNRLAHWLRARGVSEEDRVALLLPRSAELIRALLGVMRAGAAYVPIEPSAPWPRTRHVLDDARPRLILTQRASFDARSEAAALPAGSEWVVLEDIAEELAGQPETAPRLEQGLTRAAYVLYTSGSTGQPKGVVIEHRQLLNYAVSVSHELGLAACRRFAITSTVAADLGHTTLFGGLFNGGCLVIASDSDMSDAHNFAAFLARQSIDCLKIVPSHLEALLGEDTRRLPSTIVLGGEATPLSLAHRIREIEPDCRLFNHYGPTETTVGVMIHEAGTAAAEAAASQTGSLPLTRVLPNCEALVLDAQLRLVPIGQVGELYIGGAQVCRGYVSRGSEHAFVDHPFSPGERLYRTGDLARHRPRGGIELVGRADDQVKISGYRVEPAEVEAVLRALPGVRAGVVCVQPSPSQRGPQLNAYVVVDDTSDQSWKKRILDELRLALPEPMLPREIVLLGDLPRLGNGKIDRAQLSQLTPGTGPRHRKHVAPANEVEAGILSAMSDVLDRPDLGVQDNFFELGGNSLLAIKLVSRLRERFQVEVPLNAVFDQPSPELLARVVAPLCK